MHASTAPATQGTLRLVRGTSVGLTATTLAATGHAVVGGMLPAPDRLVLLAVGSVAVSVLMSGRRWHLPSLLAVLLGAQLAFHVAFAEGAHHMGAMPGSTSPVLMVAAHVLAATVTAVVLERGEGWSWALADLLLTPWRTPALVGVVPAPRPRALTVVLPLVESQCTVDVVRRRGPPAAAVA